MKKVLAFFLVLVMLLSLAACSSTTTSEQASGETSSEATAAVSSSGDTVTTTVDEDGEVVAYLMSSQVSNHLDGCYATGGLVLQTITQLYSDSLVMSDHAADVTPWLAEQQILDDDQMGVTYVLRQGVKWDDGTDVTIDDVIFSFQRMIDGGFTNVWQVVPYLGEITRVDDYTMHIAFTQSWPDWKMSCAATMVEKSRYEAEDYEEYWSHPAATGPYVITDFDPVNLTVTLEKSPNFDTWFGWELKGVEPSNIDKWVITMNVGESTTRVSAMRAGEVDVIDGVPSSDVETLKNEGINVIEYVTSEHIMLQLGCGEGQVFENEALRKAVSLCIDRDVIVEAIIGGGAPATWPTLTGYKGYVEGYTYEYDPDTAKQLVADNYDGTEIEILLSSSAINKGNEVAQAIQSFMQEVGFNVKISMLENAAYEDTRMAGGYGMCLASFTGSNGDVYREVVDIIGKDRFMTGWYDEEVMGWCDQLNTEMDPDVQEELHQKIFQYEVDHYAPQIHLYETCGISATSANLTGLIQYSDGVQELLWCQKN